MRNQNTGNFESVLYFFVCF